MVTAWGVRMIHSLSSSRAREFCGKQAKYRSGAKTTPDRYSLSISLVPVQVDELVRAAPNAYKNRPGGRTVAGAGYANTVSEAKTLYSHSRVKLPYGLLVVGH